jgi:hypothetical protein
MTRLAWAQSLVVACLFSGCLSGPAPADQPARIVDPDDASRAELRRTVSEALQVEDVMLADDALTDSSVLVIERKRVRGLDNAPLSGRDLGTPERFRLVQQDERCVLVHESSGRRFDLPSAQCVAL